MPQNLLAIPQWIWTDPPLPTIPQSRSSTRQASSKAFNTFNLIFDSFRHIFLGPQKITDNRADGMPVRSWIKPAPHSALTHLGLLFFHRVTIEILVYPACHLVPLDHPILGLDHLVGRIWLFLLAGLNTYHSTLVWWHLAACVTIASGMYTAEDFPRLYDYFWLADSMREFWGRRWHQLLRVRRYMPHSIVI